MNGGCPVIATLIFPDLSIRIVNGIISTGDKKCRIRIVFIGSFWRFRRISLNVFPPAPKTVCVTVKKEIRLQTTK